MSILGKASFKSVRYLIISLILAFFFFTSSLANQQTRDTLNNLKDTLIYLPIVLRQSNYRESTGVLDPDFGGDGRVTTDFGQIDYGAAVVLQQDGKIVVAGSTNDVSGLHGNFALVRYNPDGSLDSSFGVYGNVVTDFSGQIDSGLAAALQADGKIVVAGGSGETFALARYLPNGNLDTSFGTSGLVTTNFSSFLDWGNSIAIQPDGKILVAGQVYINRDCGIARYNPNGSLDYSFDGDGLVTTDFDGNYDYCNAMALQSDGKIVVSGENSGNLVVVRYNPNGSLDNTFDNDGIVMTDFSSSGDSIVLQRDGTIIVAGESNGDFAVARFNPDGSWDMSFEGDGKVLTDFSGDWDNGTAVALQENGKIVVAGGSLWDFAVARYNPDGSLDMSFSSDGLLTTDFNRQYDIGTAIAIQEDFKIVVVGSTSNEQEFVTEADFAVARYK